MAFRSFTVGVLLSVLSFAGYGQSEAYFASDILYVKMKDEAGYIVQEGQLQPIRKDQVEILKELAGLGSWSRSHEVPDSKLEQWRREAEQNLNEKLPDFRMEFRFRLQHAENRDKALALLTRLPEVAEVQRVPLPVQLPLPADYTAQQLYKPDTEIGIGADNVWIVYQNKGENIKFCDVELGFNASHVDLPVVTVIGPPAEIYGDSSGSVNHGTAVLGEVVSLDNGWGTTGAAPGCRTYFSAAVTTQGFSPEAAITRALDTLVAGDVLLLELQINGPNTDSTTGLTQRGMVPIEWYKPVYYAIKLAVGKGITVVEAAGNGSENLDDPIYAIGNSGHYPFLPANNSGAIIVGAGGVGGRAAPRSRLAFSNYGSRVDVQGNGERITTTGYGDLYDAEGGNYLYTGVFGGTSGASPIVSAAVILLQSVYKSHNNGAVLSPAAMSDLLKTTGKPQLSGIAPVSEHIGPLPDAYAAIKKALENATGLPSLSPVESAVIFPNPGKGMFNLLCPGGIKDATAIQVSDVSGRILRSYTLAKGSNALLPVNLTEQPAGIYFVKVVSARQTTVQRIVLEH